MDSLLIYTDGASRGNPGSAGAGAVIFKGEELIAEIKQFLGQQTNNWSEYEAVALALSRVKDMGLEQLDVEIKLDSKLVAEQLSGNWKIKSDTIRDQYRKVQEILSKGFAPVTYTHIRRELNTHADQLANDAIDDALRLRK
tara:strand:+ start:1019 stop:1441 length:423 start_codon:yes stop_codon:yes gene_type:complete